MSFLVLLTPALVVIGAVALLEHAGGPFRRLRIEESMLESTAAAATRIRVRNLVSLLAAAVAAGILVPVGVATLDANLGQLIVVAALIVAATAVAVFAIVPSATLPEPRGLRGAELTRRRLWSFAPRWLVASTAAAFALLGSVVVALGASASETGRALVWSTELTTRSAGPYPGFFYGVPVLAATAVLLVATLFALARISSVARPTAVALREVDDVIRRIAVRVILKLTSAALLFTAGALLVAAGSATTSVARPMYGGIDVADGGDDMLSPAVPSLAILGQVEIGVGLACLLATVALTSWSLADAARKPVELERETAETQ